MAKPVHTYGKAERLKSKKLIATLYEHGQIVKAYPFRVKYLWHEHDAESSLQTGVSVSKRNFKRAVDRNRVKRLIREAYRLNNEPLKNLCNQPTAPALALMIMYSSNVLPTYADTEKAVRKLIAKIQVTYPK